jgi:hypothetical protein
LGLWCISLQQGEFVSFPPLQQPIWSLEPCVDAGGQGGNYVLVDCTDIANDMDRIAKACHDHNWGDWLVKGRLVFDHHYTEVSGQSC